MRRSRSRNDGGGDGDGGGGGQRRGVGSAVELSARVEAAWEKQVRVGLECRKGERQT